MYEYDIKYFPTNEFGENINDVNKCIWFGREYLKGWELVGPDYTHVSDGGYNSGGKYQGYIFRRKIFENTPDHQFIEK